MVRIRDIIRWDRPEPRPVRKGIVPVEPSINASQAVRPALNVPPAFETADAADTRNFYQQLLAGCTQVFDHLQMTGEVVLADLPTLAERLVSLMEHGDEHLTSLSIQHAKPFSLAQHGTNVAILLVRVGCELGLKREHQVDFALLGFLHDVGMVSVEELARRAQRLERSERLTLEKHPLYSQYLLERNRDLPGFVARVAALEHERCDGSGYPNRLGGRKLSEHGHLLGLIDVYEALTHQRPFRSRVSSWQAMRMILQQQRHHFHPEAVRAFLQVVPAFPLGSRVRLSDGRCAQVTAVHAGAHSAPTVRLYQEQAGTPMHMGDAIDLRREASLYIVDTVESTVMTDPEACT